MCAPRRRSPPKEDPTGPIVYLPEGGSVGIDTSRPAGQPLEVTWFDPRTGETFSAPDDQDWVLVVDAGPR